MPAVSHVEVWSNYACAGGARLAIVRDVLALKESRTVDGRDSLTLLLPATDPAVTAAPTLKEPRQAVLRVAYADAPTTSFDEWRIRRTQRHRDGERLLLEVSCIPPLQELATCGFAYRIESDGLLTYDSGLLGLTPAAHLAVVLAAAPSYFVAGTVDPTAVVDLLLEWDTPLSALRKLCAACSPPVELQARRNGTTDYRVDLLTAIGASAAVPRLWAGKNLRGSKIVLDSERQATRLFPRGGGEEGAVRTIARAKWKVSAVSAGAYVELTDPAGGDGPAQIADQFNTGATYYLRRTSGTLEAITDTVVVSVTTSRLHLADTTGFSVNDLIEFRSSSGGADLTWLPHPNQTTYGVIARRYDREDLDPDVRNLLANPLLNGTYASGIPNAGWAKLGTPTVTENTTALYTRHGGKSTRVQATADGQGLETSAVTIAPTDGSPYFSGFVVVRIISGRVRFELVDATGSRSYPDGTSGKAWESRQEDWVELGVEGVDLKAVASTSAKLRVVADAGAAEFYVDAAQLTQSPYQRALLAGDGAVLLWQAANEELLAVCGPSTEIEVAALDLERLAPAKFPHEAISLGGTAEVRDEDVGVLHSSRVISLGRDLLREAVTDLELSSRAEDLADLLGRPARRRRERPVADATIIGLPSAQFEYRLDRPGLVMVTLGARPAGASLFYILQTAGASPPVTGLVGGVNEWVAYGGTFAISLTAADQQLAAYAQLGDIYSPVALWRIDQDDVPEMIVGLTENPGGTLVFNGTPDDDVGWYVLFRKKHVGGVATGSGEGWPALGYGAGETVTITRSSGVATAAVADSSDYEVGQIIEVTGAAQNEYNGRFQVQSIADATHITYNVAGAPATPATGTITLKPTVLNQADRVGLIHVERDGGATDNTGAPLAGMADGTGVGGTQWSESGYSNTDVAAVVAVPYGRGETMGPRACARRTMTGAASAVIDSFSVSNASGGSSCASPATYSLAYACSGTVSGTHDLKLYRLVNGAESLVTTVTDPSAGSPATDAASDHYLEIPSKGGVPIDLKYRADLVLQATGEVLDTRLVTVPDVEGITCSAA